MCVQYKVQTEAQSLLRQLRATRQGDLPWPGHVFPRYAAPVAAWGKGGRVLRTMRFGLVPFYEKSAQPKRVFHNARSETIAEKPSFRQPFLERRCLVPMAGFFEYIWVSDKDNWLAWFAPEDGRLLVSAGIWHPWRGPEGAVVDSFAIVTRDPPESISRAGHDRCPVFLPETAWDDWLDPSQRDLEQLAALMRRTEPVTFIVTEVPKPSRRKQPGRASKAQPDLPLGEADAPMAGEKD